MNCSDTGFSTCNLKVHIAVEIFKTLNVYHSHPTVAFCDKTTGNTCNRSLNGNTCIHKSKGRTTDRALRSRTVRRKNFGNKANGVGEFFCRRNYGNKCAFCKCAVSYFTTTRATAGLGFANRVGRHIVVVDITLFGFVVNAIKKLAITH